MALVSIGTNSGKNATNLAITVPAGGVPAGSLIEVCISSQGGAPASITTDTAGNTYLATGAASETVSYSIIHYCYNCAALSSGNTIVVHYTSQTYAISALYRDDSAGAITSDPRDSAAEGTNTFNSTNLTVSMSAVPAVASSLGVVCVAYNGTAAGGSYTQPTGWATPPTWAGTSGNPAGGNQQVEGGTKVTSTQDTYSGTFSSGGHTGVIVAVFKPPSAVETPVRGWEAAGTLNPYVKMPSAIGGSPT